MATFEAVATVNPARATAQGASGITSSTTLNAAAKTDGTHGTTFTAALAVLVADGALPTQAHVTACNNAWTTYKADIDALTAAVGTVTGDVCLYIGSVANVADMNKLRNCLRKLEEVVASAQVLATGSGTPRSP